MNESIHTIIARVEDRPEALNRIVSKCRQRSFHVKSLTLGTSETPGIARLTLVVDADTDAYQVVHQLGKLIEVVDIRDVTDADIVAREMALIKVRCDAGNRGHVAGIAHAFRAHIIDFSPDSVIVEVTGDGEKIDALIHLLREYGIIEMVRMGRIAMMRGSAPSHPSPASESSEHFADETT